MNKAKRAARAKAKAKEKRIERASVTKRELEVDYKWDGQHWIKLIPYWVKGQGQAYKTEVMPLGFEPPAS